MVTRILEETLDNVILTLSEMNMSLFLNKKSEKSEISKGEVQ